MKAIRWSLPCSITPLSRTSVSPLPPALCGKAQRMPFIIPRLRQQFFRLGNPFLTRPAGVVRVMQRHAADIRLTDQPGRARIAIAASSMWKKNLGVEAKLQNQEWKTMLDTMHTHNFDAVRYAWMPHRKQGCCTDWCSRYHRYGKY